MIPRYSRPEMARIFAPENKLRIWLDVELAALEALAERGDVPAEIGRTLRPRAMDKLDALIDPDRIDEIERTTRHDVIAFLTHVEAVLGEDARFLHLGMTSSDLLDTTLAVQLDLSAALNQKPVATPRPRNLPSSGVCQCSLSRAASNTSTLPMRA